MKYITIIISLLGLSWSAIAQNIKGHILDSKSSEPLTGVNVYYKDKGGTRGTVSDINGYYELRVTDGEASITFSYLGYETTTLTVHVAPGQFLTQDVRLEPRATMMDEVVVSVGRHEQKLSEVTVSMDLLKADEITRQAPKDLTDVLKNISGVEVTDRQPSIRGGTGWTYGVGSRCLILVDGMSVLTPASGEINWNMIPMENIDQVEVLKGASSVLYGSSALNGLIHIRTKRPSLEPHTRVNLQGGLYGSPSPVSAPLYGGLDLSHTRQIKNLDLSLAGNTFIGNGYRIDNYNRRVRLGGNLTYRDPNIQGLNYGANLNYLYNDYTGFFIWRSPDEPYTQSPLANMGRREHSFYIDPFLNYTNEEKGTTHRLKGRFYHRGSRIITHTTNKSLYDITNNMGFQSSSWPELSGMLGNWQQTLLPIVLPHLTEVMNGSVSGLINDLGELGNHFFPNATSADYMDLVSWIMGHTPLPSDGDIAGWLQENADKPANNRANQGTDHTYAYDLDYQFSKAFDASRLTVGGTYERIFANSAVTGKHWSDNVALFAQYDQTLFDRLNLSLGLRLEYYRVDDNYREAETNLLGVNVPVKPVFRGGLNYALGEYSFLRASFGQGYRYPSVTEKFILKDIGGVGAFPNKDLKAEQGYNAEVGIKQGYAFGNLKGFIDAAAFYTRYKDMIEFRFGLFNNTTFDYIDGLAPMISTLTSGEGLGIGAQFTNVGRAEIYGVDLSTNGVYTFNKDTRLNYMLGYVYNNPIDLDVDSRKAEEEANDDLLAMRSKSNDNRYLKYRQKHSVKAVLDLEWKRFNFGTNLSWKSKTLAVDYFMVDEREKLEPNLMDYLRGLLFGNLHDYWAENNRSYLVMDLRAGMRITDRIHLQAQVNNIWNKRYTARPMDVGTPRTFILQLGLDL